MKAVQLSKDGYVLRGDLNSSTESPRNPASAGEPAAWGPLLGSSPPLAASGLASGFSGAGITFPGLSLWSGVRDSSNSGETSVAEPAFARR